MRYAIVLLPLMLLTSPSCKKKSKQEAKRILPKATLDAGMRSEQPIRSTEKFLAAPADVARPPREATKTRSGLFYKLLADTKEGKHPQAMDRVLIHFSGWTTDGTLFESSITKGAPQEFWLGSVIPGWAEGIKIMTTGDKARFWIPEDLAYQGRTGNPSGMLVFDIELVEILKAAKAPRTPKRLSPPKKKKAKKTKSGVYYQVLRRAPKRSKRTPVDGDRVKVHYSSWTRDGTLVDSSRMRAKPATFSLDKVIEGWRDGLQVMHVGEKTRFWIPQKLAYKGEAGRPKGMLIFDVELLDIISGVKQR